MHVAGGMSPLLLPAAVTQGQLDRALEVCERIAARDRSSLYLTSQFLEDRSRYDAFIAMYAIMRHRVGGFDFETCGRELGRFAYRTGYPLSRVLEKDGVPSQALGMRNDASLRTRREVPEQDRGEAGR